ncbi:sensor histidine kinase [Sinobaca sp. H24]|uniref:ATP-binding protein n=1 Tax=Sinobaca sp. H24 TaxID=2923376 RepID=UPI00207958CD|nr:sensor histidine kinase [Sinobaca sp. H24]
MFSFFKRFPLKLLHKMILLMSVLLVISIGTAAFFVFVVLSDSLEKNVGDNALNLAITVANIPDIQEAFSRENPEAFIQPIVDPMREQTDAEFIVVGNTEEIRYSHPEQNRIGEQMIGADNERALLGGESYVSREEGSLGPSIRGKAPVYDEDGTIIGVVSVGFLVNEVNDTINAFRTEIMILLAFLLTVSIIGAVFIAYHIKKQLFGLEPAEISQLYLQKETILQTTYEGIIAFDRHFKPTLINHAASTIAASLQYSHRDEKENYLVGLIPASLVEDVYHSGESLSKQEIPFDNTTLILSLIPIKHEKEPVGAVASFHHKSELDVMAKELSQTLQYADTLRAQAHEFFNKLFTISGMLQLGKKEEAVQYIQEETNIQQSRLQFFIKNVSDPALAGLLLGKYNQASELKTAMHIDEESSLASPLSEQQRRTLLTVIGNLIENAFDALAGQPDPAVWIHFHDAGDNIIIEVEDNGPGISEDVADSLFEKGITTRQEKGRGIGLHLCHIQVKEAGGFIYVEEGEYGGACFIAVIPK